MDNCYFTNAVNFAKVICSQKLRKGDTAVDATMGNGNDTVYLCKLVGEKGRIYAFDIQKEAIENTKRKLIESGINTDVRLILDGHENMDKYIDSKVKLVIFNLGYLPKGEHCITTKAETTMKAIKKAADLIDAGGMIIVIVYDGHDSGKIERKAIEDYIASIDQKEFTAVKLEFTNQVNNPPVFISIEKRK